MKKQATPLFFGRAGLDDAAPDPQKERDFGQLYLEHKPATPGDELLVEDLAATMLVNSRVAPLAATSVYRYGATIDLRSLPSHALEETTDAERQRVADIIGTMTSWPWVGALLATKHSTRSSQPDPNP